MPRPQRILPGIRILLSSDERHDWSIGAIQTELRKQGTSADFSSVFRALTRLEERGEVRKVDVGDSKARYETIADDHHDHIRCEDCGKVSAIPGCEVRVVERGVAEATGYRVTNHQAMFLGLCASCADRGS